MRALALLRNEIEKIVRRRRFRVVLLILVGVLAMSTYAEWRTRNYRARERGGVETPWRVAARERLVELQSRARRSGRYSPVYQRALAAEMERLHYHLEHGIDPNRINGVTFARGFASASSYLLLPLLVAIVASDLVSAEFSEGTIKLLATRPVARWKLMTAKVAAMALFVSLIVLAAGGLAWAIAGITSGWRGWGAPSLAGFRFTQGALDVAAVRLVPAWRDLASVYGLAWFAALTVGCMTLALSTFLRSAAATMGTILATLVGGTILPRLANDWELSKYLFVTNLPLPDFYSGTPPPFADMTMGFSVTVLAVWAVASLAAAYAGFTRRDILA